MLPSLPSRRECSGSFELLGEQDLIVDNAVISACEKGQQWELALELFAEMTAAKVAKSEVTRNVASSAYANGSSPWICLPRSLKSRFPRA